MFKSPALFPSELSKEQRLEIIRSAGSRARRDFEKRFPAIENWFSEYDPIYLLSYCATYFLSVREGTDPEATGRMDFYPFYVEIMQAFALYKARNSSLKPLMQEAEKLRQEMKEIGELMSWRLLDIPDEITQDSDLHAYHLRTGMMNNTTAVRNWAYFHQMRKVVLDLCKTIEKDFEGVHKIKPVTLMDLLFKLTEERNDLLNEHRTRLRSFIRKSTYQEMIQAYNTAFPAIQKIEEDQVETLWASAGKKKRNLIGLLICHSDLRLEDIYSFTLEHAQQLLTENVPNNVLRDVLNKLSYQFGDLKDFKREHIILSNPVHRRPFIKLQNDVFYSAIWGAIPHFALDLLEDLIWEDEKLREKYTAAKAKYLEDEVERIVKGGFPHGIVHRGSLWKDSITDKEYENDITLVIDNFALIIEAKSGSVSDPAKRGAPDRLFGTLRALIEEPSEQALRFIEHLERDKKVHTFQTKRGEQNIVDSTKVKYYIPLGVTFSHLGTISSNLKQLVEAQVVSKKLEQLAPSMSFTDLEAVFDLLPSEVEKVHYLARRREFEAHMNYEGDELDLLAFYLDNGFNIGDTEYAQNSVLMMSLKSKELDMYFVGKSEGRRVPKPELALTGWWKDLLNTISTRRSEGWVETGFILLNTTKEDQDQFEKKLKQLISVIISGKAEKPHNWVMFASGPERRRYVIAGYPYTTLDKELRNGVMSEILFNEHAEKARGVVVIGVNITRRNYPYSVLSRRTSTDLFDTLTL